MTVATVTIAPVADPARRYVAIAAAGYPGAALRWGEFGHHLGPIAPDRLAGELRALLAALPVSDPGHEVGQLRRSLGSRLFELAGLGSWRHDPQFYVDRRCVGVLNLIVWYEELHPGSVPEPWCHRFLAWLPGVVEAARRNLDPAEVAQVDARTGLERARTARDALEWVLGRFSFPAAEAVGALAAVDELVAFLDALAGRGTGGQQPATLTRPIGGPALAEGLRIRTGTEVDLETLERRCAAMVRWVSPGRAGVVPADGGMLRNLAEEVTRFVEPIWGVAGAPPVEIRAAPPALAGSISSAAYHEPLHGGTPLVLVNPAGYRSLTDLRLDLIHEGVPGHHWQRSAYWSHHDRHPACRSAEDHALVEGWARWCEHWYAERLPVADASVRFAGRLAKYAGQAVAAIRVHRGRPLAEVGSWLATACGWPRRRGIAVTVSAYLDPWAAITPVLGYLALRWWSDEHGERALCQRMADDGRVDLADVDLTRGS